VLPWGVTSLASFEAGGDAPVGATHSTMLNRRNGTGVQAIGLASVVCAIRLAVPRAIRLAVPEMRAAIPLAVPIGIT
jgi:hypothetical protein